MTVGNAAFVLVHGAWHDPRTWDALGATLTEAGHPVYAPDLGLASDPSQKGRTEHVLKAVEAAYAATGLPVILVGHSIGGVTVSDVAEENPELVSAVIYTCAYMVPPGLIAGDIRRRPSMSASLVPTLLTAPPQEVGVLRIDPDCEDGDYRDRLRRAFAEGMTPAEFEHERTLIRADEPLVAIQHRSAVTKERFGRLTRVYVRTLEDRALLPAAQTEMIEEVDAAIGSATIVRDLPTGHGPHLTMTRALADILLQVASTDGRRSD